VIKILLVADLKGWIFERHCREIRDRLSHKYKLDIVYSRPHGRKLAQIAEDYDIVYALDPMPLNYPPKEKVMMGCRAEWLHGPGNEKDFYDNGLKRGCKEIKDKCSLFHVVNKRQVEMFKDVVTDKPFYLAQHGVNTKTFNSQKYTRVNDTRKIVVGTSGRKASNCKKGFGLVQKACESLGIEFITSTYEGKKLTMEEMPSYYNKIDVYVCMSLTEGLCNPLMEAGAMGIPVISTRSGAAEEMIFDGENGFLVEREENALKEALIKIQDPNLRKSMSSKIETEMVENWSWDVRIKDYEVMFDKMVEVRGL
jgi:glycosyltransferase involved in cell wall biosynthesis